ncbi:hypothetical protein B0J11DRAFT_440730 [Dendryphion nanum]|uniref:Inositol-1-monophosphatase n=1 Tax=Dendryphion nanum TaxID=256645 RepID=A0A9P9DH92_9PLEO|nr:hypothetical protein B0J11DRAFT_440730 [Dendryphion nanum]
MIESADAFDNGLDSSDASTAPTPDCITPYINTPTDLKIALSKHMLSESLLTSIRNELVAIARSAGQMMLDADPSVNTSDTKKNSSDRVTETDKAIETMVQSRLRQYYPEFKFLGEETFKVGQKLSNAPTFVCDPIDGTLNFIHGFPNTAVSLALTIEKKPVVGVVYNPFRGDLYTAVKNQGAYLTSSTGRIHRLPLRSIPAPLTSLNGCLVALEWGSERIGLNWDLRSSMSQSLLSSKDLGGAMVHSIRSSGSAALDFCYVAAGQMDLFWEGGCWIWDVCAGWCILEEAGGIVANANPGDWNPELEGRCYLAVRGAKKVEQMGVVRELWNMIGERRFKF